MLSTVKFYRLTGWCVCSPRQSRRKLRPQPLSPAMHLPLRPHSQSIPKTSRLRPHSRHSSCLSHRLLSPSSQRQASSSQARTTPLAHQRLEQPPSQRPGRRASPLRAASRPHLRLVWLRAQVLRRLSSPMLCPLQVGSFSYPQSIEGTAGSAQSISWLHAAYLIDC